MQMCLWYIFTEVPLGWWRFPVDVGDGVFPRSDLICSAHFSAILWIRRYFHKDWRCSCNLQIVSIVFLVNCLHVCGVAMCLVIVCYWPPISKDLPVFYFSVGFACPVWSAGVVCLSRLSILSVLSGLPVLWSACLACPIWFADLGICLSCLSCPVLPSLN